MVNAASSSAAQSLHQVVEDCGVDDLQELYTGDITLHPADMTFQRFQSLQLESYDLVQLRDFDEFDFAPVPGEIVDAHTIVALGRAPQMDLRAQGHPLAAPTARHLLCWLDREGEKVTEKQPSIATRLQCRGHTLGARGLMRVETHPRNGPNRRRSLELVVSPIHG